MAPDRWSAEEAAAICVDWRDGVPVFCLIRTLTDEGEPEDKWIFPKGRIDARDGGDPRRAAIREAAEEAGIVVEITAAGPLGWHGSTAVYLARRLPGRRPRRARDTVRGEPRWLPADAARAQLELGRKRPGTWTALLDAAVDAVSRPRPPDS